MISCGTPVFCGNASQTASPITINITIGAGDTIYLGGVHNTTGFTSSSLTCTSFPASAPTITTIGSPVTDTDGAQAYEHWYVQAPGAGAYTFSYSVVDTGDHWLDMFGVPIVGGATSGILVAHGPGQFQSTPATTTDIVTSGVAQTPSAYPALVVAYSVDSFDNLMPNAGTGFTSVGTGFGNFGSANGGRLISKRITSGTAQGLFTVPATNGHMVTMMAVFQEAVVATPSDNLDTPGQRLMRGNLPHLRMSPRSQREAQQFCGRRSEPMGLQRPRERFGWPQ